MLDYAKFYDVNEINKKIVKENPIYLWHICYASIENICLEDDEWSKIQRVSLNKEGKVIAYFLANINRTSSRINSLYLIKFKSDNDYDSDIAKNDLKEFVEGLINSPIFRMIEFIAIRENPANNLYEKWLEVYGGKRYLIEKYTLLPDGKYHDTYLYIIPTKSYNKGEHYDYERNDWRA